ncbi:MAG: hypothetical protein EAY75_01265 [Bacteroidetes bacterium]|nr:MAG: hypothetical protein EAY75_01265 [Bacteroidota bacterium]
MQAGKFVFFSWVGAMISLCVLQGCGDSAPAHKLLEKGRFVLKKNLQFALTDENAQTVIQLDFNEREAILDYDKKKQRILAQYHVAEIKYLNHLGDILAYIRYEPDAILCYNADKKLAWKVNILSDKIQLSDNAENNNPFEIRLADNGAYKVFSNNKQIGEVVCKQGVLTAKGNRRFETLLKANHPAFGLLLLNDVPEEWRMILMAELLRY